MKKDYLAQPAFVLNVMLVICGFIGLIISCFNLKVSMFEYYTQDSNIFCLISALIYVIASIRAQKAGKDPLIALIPTAVYAAVTIVLNILRLIEGPYPFLMVHQQTPLASVAWCATILLIAWLIAEVIRGMHNRNYARFMKYEKEN